MTVPPGVIAHGGTVFAEEMTCEEEGEGLMSGCDDNAGRDGVKAPHEDRPWSDDTIERRWEELLGFLTSLEDWLSLYSYLIDSTFSLEPMTGDERERATLIEDCQSETWLFVGGDRGCVRVKVESEALIVKGLAGLLIRLFDGQPAQDVACASIDLLAACPLLQDGLDDARATGFAAMAQQVSNRASLLLD